MVLSRPSLTSRSGSNYVTLKYVYRVYRWVVRFPQCFDIRNRPPVAFDTATLQIPRDTKDWPRQRSPWQSLKMGAPNNTDCPLPPVTKAVGAGQLIQSVPDRWGGWANLVPLNYSRGRSSHHGGPSPSAETANIIWSSFVAWRGAGCISSMLTFAGS